MGRFKNIEIKGLLIKDFEEILLERINEVIKSSDLSKEEVLKKMAPKFEELLFQYEESISTFYLNNHEFNLDDFLKKHFNNQKEIAKQNKESFVAFILYINGCFVIYRKIIERLRRKKIDSILKMTVSLYGLVIRRADEIVNQLLAGYIDGAMIIWRSLYENAIVLLVLALENDNGLADKYFQHSVRNSKRKILSFNKNHKELKFPALPKSTELKLQKGIEKVNKQYGKDFLENEYGWADDLFSGKQKANFMLLEERVEMNRFRPYYILCCEQVHSNFNGLKSFMDGNKIILPRLLQQDFELTKFIDPMQFTISILHEVNDYILYEFSIEEEYNVNVLLMKKVFEKQQKTFDLPKRKNKQ
ncbi:hypothetical protein SAMN05444410_104206 [Hydrobacter penzbergensis]|uniref:Uncharacterized protein n=1 Tax=Hydrobacter penzbergensis TaxID=1235997 RepID=A0A8X8LEK7_9BACT|nr:DUF5677 domain-containing protein [Hydrobacter penzbergensis]SDW64825.1 hypothetical protein SAMN05444410_104206 [Hydrobacter penzbergensis]